jgi:exportin-1
MTQVKIKQLKESLNSEFYQIFQLCDFVMANSQKPRLLLVTLETLLKYLSWIPLGYIFETPLVQTLITKVKR